MSKAKDILNKMPESTRIRTAHAPADKFSRGNDVKVFLEEIAKVAKVVSNRLDADKKFFIVKLSYDPLKNDEVEAILNKYGFRSN